MIMATITNTDPHRDCGRHHTAGSFKKRLDGSFAFVGVVNGVRLGALIKPTGALRYAFQGKGAPLAGTKNAVYAPVISGATSVTAAISQ
jgi:hypothetical protein